MGDLQADLRKGAPKDAIVYYFNGSGTSAYEHPPTIESIEDKYPSLNHTAYRNVTLAGWSAGGRAVQRWLDQDSNGIMAVLLADALYTGLVNGKADPKPLESIFAFAFNAAQALTSDGPIFVFWHSAIVPPGYASSGQCAEAIREYLEEHLGPMESFTPPESFRATVTSAYRLGNCILLGYNGADAAEHIREAHLIDDAMQAFVPWCSPEPIDSESVAALTNETPIIDVDPAVETVTIVDTDVVQSVEVRVIHPGMTGPDVIAWQERLNAPAFNNAYNCGKVDGSFGTNTTRATRAFQIDHYVGADGCVDKSTRVAMTAALLDLANATVENATAALPRDSLELRALAIAIDEIGQHEIQGVDQNPRIQEYLRGARRNGLPIGDSEDIAWCAAFIGWCNTQAMYHGEKIPAWRVSVTELWQDALRLGTAKTSAHVPQPGDLILFKRNGQDPRVGGQGHVCMVETAPDANGRFTTIGGNEGGSLHSGGEVMRSVRRVTDAAIAGYIA